MVTRKPTTLTVVDPSTVVLLLLSSHTVLDTIHEIHCIGVSQEYTRVTYPSDDMGDYESPNSLNEFQ